MSLNYVEIVKSKCTELEDMVFIGKDCLYHVEYNRLFMFSSQENGDSMFCMEENHKELIMATG